MFNCHLKLITTGTLLDDCKLPSSWNFLRASRLSKLGCILSRVDLETHRRNVIHWY